MRSGAYSGQYPTAAVSSMTTASAFRTMLRTLVGPTTTATTMSAGATMIARRPRSMFPMLRRMMPSR